MTMSNRMLTNHIHFTDVWEEVDDFKSDLAESPFADVITSDNQDILYYLLYAKYGNSSIANDDLNQFKYRVFSIMFQYGPSWEKRLDVQAKLRALQESDLLKGSRAIYNHALNPDTAPTTEELNYVSEQNTTKYTKSKMDAYGQLWDLLRADVTGEFINKFKVCFAQFVFCADPIYVSETEEEEDED